MNPNTSPRPSWLAYLALAVVCILWGTTFLAMRIGVMDIPPFLFSGIRQLSGGLILTAIVMGIFKQQLPAKEVMLQQALGGFFMITLGNGLVAFAEVHVSSSVAAIICSMVPIWIILMNLLINQEERPTFPVLLGLVIGLAGIVMIFGENLSEFANPGYRWGIFLIFVANLGWAWGSIWMKKRNTNSNPFMNAGLQMIFGGLFLFPASALFDDYATLRWTTDATWALLYVIVFGSLLAFAAFSYAVKKLPITIVSLYAYVNPIVAVILGSLMLGEKFNLRIAIAMMITILGIYIVNKGFQLRALWRAQFSR